MCLDNHTHLQHWDSSTAAEEVLREAMHQVSCR